MFALINANLRTYFGSGNYEGSKRKLDFILMFNDCIRHCKSKADTINKFLRDWK